MATTFYTVNMRLEFTTKADRNTVYTAVKGTMATLKETTPWVSGKIVKDDYTTPDVSEEAI